jgi:DNA-binding NarL/FixJ family response regulator
VDEQTRVVIADDHPIFREGLVRTIDRHRSFLVVGEAADGGEALRLITEVHPDVAVLDVSMPVMDGLEVARRAHQSALPTQLVILTMYKDAAYFNAALDLGVRGYVVKDDAVAQLMACLAAVGAGETYVSPSFSHLMAERYGSGGMHGKDRPLREQLTPAELSILRMVSENRTSKEIAEKLYVSVRTVENHRMHMCVKLGLKGPHALLQFALENRSVL